MYVRFYKGQNQYFYTIHFLLTTYLLVRKMTKLNAELDPKKCPSIPYKSIISTRVRGITHSISARRWEGDGFDAQPKPFGPKQA